MDAAIVYASDLIGARGVRRAFSVEGSGAPAISYPAAVVAASGNREEAARFLTFLQGTTAGALFTRYGFEPARER